MLEEIETMTISDMIALEGYVKAEYDRLDKHLMEEYPIEWKEWNDCVDAGGEWDENKYPSFQVMFDRTTMWDETRAICGEKLLKIAMALTI